MNIICKQEKKKRGESQMSKAQQETHSSSDGSALNVDARGLPVSVKITARLHSFIDLSLSRREASSVAGVSLLASMGS